MIYSKNNGNITPASVTALNDIEWENEAIRLHWTSDRGFFGGVDIYIKDDKFYVSTEMMGKDFAKELFCAIIDNAELVD